ncbi:hypothetical protein EON83_11685 [bacterium]|nr:MAG: hypothetical protein EON83_11685 [bacterium]
MAPPSPELGNSTQEQESLRAVALWAADCAEQALAIFESRHPTDTRPREAIEAGREFGRGKKRDKTLRVLSLAALKAGKDADTPSKYAAQAATLAASVAYTHTDLQTGLQGVRQARHLLGPAVYAALALETATKDDSHIAADVIQRAIETAPPEVSQLLKHMPPQPREKSRLSILFADLDSALRTDESPSE